MTIGIDELRAEIGGRDLPGGSIVIEPHESAIADHALRAVAQDAHDAHPIWFVIASLRGMGISVDDLCSLARKDADDTLLLGRCEVVQDAALHVGGTYRTAARIGAIDTRTTRDGSRLDSVEVVVSLLEEERVVGRVTSQYLFKRAGQ